MGNRNQTQWVVKLSSDKMIGPISTEKVIEKILDGTIQGDEQIQKYPQGQWQEIVKENTFFEAFVEVLEKTRIKKKEVNPRTLEETVIVPNAALSDGQNLTPKEGFGSNNLPEEIKALLLQRSHDSKGLVVNHKANEMVIKPFQSEQKIENLEGHTNSQNEVLDLTPFEKKKLTDYIPQLTLISFIIFLGFYIFFKLYINDANISSGTQLIYPTKSEQNWTKKEIDEATRKSFVLYNKSGFDNYIDAQKILVEAIENDKTSLETRSLLCMVQKKLWPFTNQDIKNQKALFKVLQSVRNVSPSSAYTRVCEAVYLMITSRLADARGLIENTLENLGNERFEMLPAMYFLKGEILELQSDFLNASAYFDQTSNLWPNLVDSKNANARVLYKQNKFVDANSQVQSALSLNAKSLEAKYWQAIIMLRAFNQPDEAYGYFIEASQIDDRVPGSIEAIASYYFAELLFAKNNKSKAIEYAERALKINPSNKDYQNLVSRLGGSTRVMTPSMSEALYIGDQYFISGDFFSAQAEYKAVFDLNPKNTLAAYKAAKSLWSLNQTREAIEWLNKALKSDRKFIAALILQADYYSQLYDFEKATLKLAEAKKIESQSYDVSKGFAQLEYRKNNFPAAIQLAEHAIKKYDGDVELYILLGEAYSKMASILVVENSEAKDAEKKIEYMSQAKKYTNRAVEIEPSSADAQIAFAKYIAVSQGVDFAINYLNDFVKAFPYTASYRLAVADLNKSEERYNIAASLYSQVVELDPRSKKAYLGLGDCQRAMGLNKEAMQSYLRAVKQDPSDVEPLFQAGRLMLEVGNNQEAIRYFEKVILNNATYPKVYIFLGKAYFSDGKIDQAMESAKKEKKLNPRIVDSYLLIADVLKFKKQYLECAQEYSSAIKLRPQFAEIYVKAAICYRLADSLDVAEDMLSLAISKESGYAEIYREQGALFERKGDLTLAAAAYEKYLQLSPNAPDKKQVEAVLSKISR
jgi:tetratricopeptide (TPR) repeat protein